MGGVQYETTTLIEQDNNGIITGYVVLHHGLVFT